MPHHTALLMLLCLVASAGAYPREVVIEHALVPRHSTVCEVVARFGAEAGTDAELARGQLSVRVPGGRVLAVREYHFDAPRRVVAARVEAPAPLFTPRPAELAVRLKVGERVVERRVPVWTEALAGVVRTFSVPRPRDAVPASELQTYTEAVEGIFARWTVALPAGARPGPEELALTAAAGKLDVPVFHVRERSVEVLVKLERRDVQTLALELSWKGRVLAQVVSPLWHSWESSVSRPKLAEAYRRARLGLGSDRDVEGRWTVRTLRDADGGTFWASTVSAQQLDVGSTLVAVEDPKRAFELVTGRLEDEATGRQVHVVGRYRDEGPAQLSVRLIAAGAEDEPVALPPLVIPRGSGSGGDERCRTAWAVHTLAALDQRAEHSDASTFLSYARGLLRRRLKEDGPSVGRDPRAGREVDVYSALTGALAVQEALQLQALAGSFADDPQTVSVASLKAPEVKSHPFQEMIGARAPVTRPMDALVPNDCLYAHFSSFASFQRALDQVEDWGEELVHLVEVRARDRGIRERYTRRLMVDTTMLSRLMGEHVIGEVGLVAADPFLRDGTDVAVLLEEKVPAALDAALALQRAKAGPLAQSAGRREDVEVTSWTSADGRVSSHQARIGPCRVVASSAALAARIAACQARRAPSMAASDDYRYMRVLFPARAEEEDGLLFLSDELVRKVVGPQTKIADARRLGCSGVLAAIENAAAFHRLERHADATLAELVTRAYLAQPRCPSHGRYTHEAARARCSVHGSLDALAPLSATPVERVTAGERDAYVRFVDEYTRYWRTFVDPVGVRLSPGERIKLSTIILPLVENSIYTGMKQFLAMEPADLAPWGALPGTLLGVAFATPQGAQRKQEHDVDWLPSEGQPGRWLGRAVSAVVHDARPLFTLDFGEGSWLARELFTRPASMLWLAFYVTSLDMPIVVSADVTSEAGARRFLDVSADRAARLSRARGFRGFFEQRFSPYKLREGAPAPVTVFTWEIVSIKLRYFAAVHAGRIWVSNQLPALIASMKAPAPATRRAHVLVVSTPGNGTASREDRELSLAERQRRACHANLVPLWALIRLGGVAEDAAAEAARARMGWAPECPEGGTYRLEPSIDAVTCSLHGTVERPVQPVAPAAGSAAARTLERLRELVVALTLTPEGLNTQVELMVTEKNR